MMDACRNDVESSAWNRRWSRNHFWKPWRVSGNEVRFETFYLFFFFLVFISFLNMSARNTFANLLQHLVCTTTHLYYNLGGTTRISSVCQYAFAEAGLYDIAVIASSMPSTAWKLFLLLVKNQLEAVYGDVWLTIENHGKRKGAPISNSWL